MAGPAPAPTMAAQPTAQPNATYQPAPMAPQPGFNVNQAAAGALQGAIGGTQRAMQAPLQVGAYANPYTSEVIDRTQQDIERQRQMAMNTLGAQATAANAFGGSRQGVAEGVMAGEYGRMAGDMAAQQRQQNYSQALQAAMSDRQARLGAASQMGQLGPAGIWHKPSNPAAASPAGSVATGHPASTYRRGQTAIRWLHWCASAVASSTAKRAWHCSARRG